MKHYTNKDYQINEAGWKVMAAVKPGDAKDGKTLTIEYTNEFGTKVVVAAKVIFENAKNYRVVNPDHTITLEKSNITSLKIIK